MPLKSVTGPEPPNTTEQVRSVGHEGRGVVGELVQRGQVDFEPTVLKGDLYIVTIVLTVPFLLMIVDVP